MQVLFVTSQWPTITDPGNAPFVKVEVDALQEIGLSVDVFHYHGVWNPIYYARAIRRFRQQLSLAPYDLVYARFGQCGIVALSQSRLPVTIRFGGSDLMGWRDLDNHEPISSKILRFVSYQVAKRATTVVVPSETTAAYLPLRPYSVVPAGINLDLFKPGDQAEARSLLGLPPDKKLILFAANPQRALKRFTLAEAAVALIPADVKAELIVATGFPHHVVPHYMNASDVLVLTSEHEGSPNVVKEALACNLPVVSVDVGDVRERVGALPACVVCGDERPETIAASLMGALQQRRPQTLRDAVRPLEATAIARKTAGVFQSMLQ